MGMIFIPGVGSGGNPNPVGSGWDPGWIGWDDQLTWIAQITWLNAGLTKSYSGEPRLVPRLQIWSFCKGHRKGRVTERVPDLT